MTWQELLDLLQRVEVRIAEVRAEIQGTKGDAIRLNMVDGLLAAAQQNSAAFRSNIDGALYGLEILGLQASPALLRCDTVTEPLRHRVEAGMTAHIETILKKCIGLEVYALMNNGETVERWNADLSTAFICAGKESTLRFFAQAQGAETDLHLDSDLIMLKLEITAVTCNRTDIRVDLMTRGVVHRFFPTGPARRLLTEYLCELQQQEAQTQ